MRTRLTLTLVVLAIAASGVWALTQSAESFPHDDHEGLFPLCSGCHVGIETGASEVAYPDPETCARCHDGQREQRVEWSGPATRASNLDFSHTEHSASVAAQGESAECVICHQEAGGEIRMAVAEAPAESCLSCHAHEAPQHLAAERECAACHVPVWEATDLPTARVAAFSLPEDHTSTAFLFEHGGLEDFNAATCVTCHARESCERCHFNASALPAITVLGRDPRVAALARDKPAEYPEPVTHQTADWEWSHGVAGEENIGSCANCHTRPSCTTCHAERVNTKIASLPLPRSQGPRGVPVAELGSRVHRDDFSINHGIRAAAQEETCLGCHLQETCVACHDGPASSEFHVGNFLEMHAVSAYGIESDCASCHSPQVFCRECHQGVGLTSAGAGDVAFHDSNPTWLFGHGGAARQGLEGCITCHSQVDCTQCHSAFGGWGINPHGPGFDPDRAADANRGGCVVCHQPGGPA